MSEQARKVQEQFGAIAAAYVASAGHAAGDDLAQILAWGRALAPPASSTWPPAAVTRRWA